MKTLKNIFATLTLVTIAAFSVNAQENTQNTQTVDAAANIIAPIELSNDVPLSFGNIVANTGGAVLLASTSGADRTPSGGVVLPNIIGNVSAARFTLTGLSGANYGVVLPSSISISNENQTESMTVDTFTSSLNDNKGIVGTDDEFYVGATLNVNADQPSGEYTGVFDVTVNYE